MAPVISVTITGEFSIEDVANLMKKQYPDKGIKLDKTEPQGGQGSAGIQGNAKEISVMYSASGEQLQYYKNLLERKAKDMKQMEESSQKALATMKTFQTQQKALLDEFIALHQKYEDQKQQLIDILWGVCTKHDPGLKNITPMDTSGNFVETETQLGQYTLGDELGSGQFASVRVCWKTSNKNQQYAIKIIKKERITTHLSLSRLSGEVGLLKKLQNQYVIGVHDTIQTQKHFYIVTERGGADMFEFFDEYDDGVPEPWAKDIMACVLISVNACHEAGVCHRDLKPENILLTFDYQNNKIADFKLCDFGLGAEFTPGVLLSDFCGSPGFFCPEMITKGTYYGDKADVWSIGGIMLELILGNERFTNFWMNAYEYEILQNRDRFTQEIANVVKLLPGRIPFQGDLKDFMLLFSKLDPNDRPTVKSIMGHPWVAAAVKKMQSQSK